jgi:hypothetical protein
LKTKAGWRNGPPRPGLDHRARVGRALRGRDVTESVAWEPLLELIEEGHVVPILGEELLQIVVDGRVCRLHDVLAARVAEALGVPAQPGDTLNTVAGHFVGRGGDLQSIYPTLKALSRDLLRKIRPPDSLLKLAAIRDFRLFVTTTFDDFAVRAIDEVRNGGKPATSVISYSPTRSNDLPSASDGPMGDTVFHLFGRVSAIPEYAVTDEDLLEFVHCLQSESRRPSVLFHHLGQKRLLMIGTSYSDWLTRFFLRLSKPEPFALRRSGDYLVTGLPQRELVIFLQHFYGKTILYSRNPLEFVDELHDRWSARNGAARVRSVAPALEPGRVPAGAVFVSYASEDRSKAQALCGALEAAGVESWFDVKDLEPGDAYDAKIRRGIEQSALFLVMISRNVLTNERRFFRKEWEYAVDVSKTVKPGTPFIVPVVIDETPIDDAGLPQEFRAASYISFRDSAVPPECVATVVKHYRAFQRRAPQP